MPDIDIAVELVQQTVDINVEMVGGGGRVDEVVAGSGVTVDASDPARPVVSASGGGGVSVGAWRQVVMPSDPMDMLVRMPVTVTAGQPDFAVSRSDGGGFTVSSAAGNTAGNERVLYVLPEEYDDVEVHVVVSAPGRQTTPAKLPQFGLGLRVTDSAAWTTTMDVFAYGVLHNTVWNWNAGGGGLKIDSGDVTYAAQTRQAMVTYATRVSGYWGLGLDRYVPLGTDITVAGTGIAGLDGSYSGATAGSGNYLGFTGPLVVFPSGGGSDIAALPCPMGRVAAKTDADTWPNTRTLFPLHLVGRVIGDRVQYRTWCDGEQDLGWTGNPQTSARTITAPVSGSDPMTLPSSGKVGFWANHLAQATGSLTYELVEVREL